QLLGRTPGAPLELSGQIEPPAFDQSLSGEALAARFVDRRLDLAALDAQEKNLLAQTSLVDALILPQLVLSYSADPGINDPWNKDWGAPSNWSQINGNLSIQLQWKLDSLLPGSTFWTQSANIAAARQALQLGRAQAKDAAKAEILTLTDQITSSTKAMEGL